MSHKDKLLEEAKRLQPYLEEKRHFLHSHPEVGFDLKETKAYLTEELKKLGYEPKSVGKCGIMVELWGSQPGKCILLRADMDALAMTEEAEVEYKSIYEGRMHGCGHDMHATMLLGAAKLLKDYEHEIHGVRKLIFQPAEEIFQGSLDMIESGVLENPKVDAAMMLHVVAGMPMPTGTFMVPKQGGVSMNTCEQYKITVLGKGGHGSAPQNAIDPITAAAQIHLGLQEINSRELGREEYGIFTTCKFQAGATSNVIPDSALMEGTIRTADLDRSVNGKIKKRMEEIATGIAIAMRCTAKVEFSDYCPCMVIDDAWAKQVLGVMKDTFGSAIIEMEPSPGGGSEDFSFVSHKVPVTSLFLVAGSTNDGYVYGQHHPKVRYDESCLCMGSAAYAAIALNV